jgi:hypothetical protein
LALKKPDRESPQAGSCQITVKKMPAAPKSTTQAVAALNANNRRCQGRHLMNGGGGCRIRSRNSGENVDGMERLTMRLSDAGLRQRRTKALYPNHRLPPRLNEDATRDRSNRLLDGESTVDPSFQAVAIIGSLRDIGIQVATRADSKAADADQYKCYSHYDEEDAVTERETGGRLLSRQERYYRDNCANDGRERAHNQSAKT